MITQEQRKQFEEDGFFILERFFSGEEMDALCARIDQLVQPNEDRLASVGQEGISRAKEIVFTSHLAEHDEGVKAFCSQPRLVELTTDLLGPHVSMYWNQSVYKHPETAKDFPWHQDNGYTAVDPEQYLTCWIALNDVTIENGCVWVLPSSHRQGTVEHQATPIGQQCYFGDDPGLPVPLSKGSMVVFSSLLFHRSGPNVSQGARKGYVVQYCDSQTRNRQTGELVASFAVTP